MVSSMEAQELNPKEMPMKARSEEVVWDATGPTSYSLDSCQARKILLRLDWCGHSSENHVGLAIWVRRNRI